MVRLSCSAVRRHISNALGDIKDKTMEFFRNRKIFVDFLAILFGIGSWVAINGMWVELPIMVQRLPEKWSLASYLSIIIQIANIGPLVYTVCYKFAKSRINDAYIIHAMMAVGATACFLFGFLWNKTTYVGGEKHSVALFALLFFMALVDCCSSVLFFPFIGKFHKKYLTSFLIGESLSSFIPSIISLGQGAGSKECRNVSMVHKGSNKTYNVVYPMYLPPRFSIEIFSWLLAGMMITSWVGFVLLKHHRSAQSEKVPESRDNSNGNDTGTNYSWGDNGRVDVEMHDSDSSQDGKHSSSNHLASEEFSSQNHISKQTYLLLLALILWICFFSNGFLPSIQTYSTLPYGNKGFHLAISLSSIVHPAVCVLALFIKLPRVKGIVVQTVLITVIAAYLLTTALMSPSPPLQGTAFGEILIVILWIVIAGLFSFTKVCVANLLRERGSAALFWYGAATQGGSFFGAVITFILTAVMKVFKSYNPC